MGSIIVFTPLHGHARARVAEFGRRTGLRIRRGNPWGFESPLSHHRDEDKVYWKLTTIFLCIALFLTAIHALAGESFNAPIKPKGSPQHTGYGKAAQKKLCSPPLMRYQLHTTPQTYRAWQKKNYWDDFENLMRGQLYKESDLEYMLRTF